MIALDLERRWSHCQPRSVSQTGETEDAGGRDAFTSGPCRRDIHRRPSRSLERGGRGRSVDAATADVRQLAVAIPFHV